MARSDGALKTARAHTHGSKTALSASPTTARNDFAYLLVAPSRRFGCGRDGGDPCVWGRFETCFRPLISSLLLRWWYGVAIEQTERRETIDEPCSCRSCQPDMGQSIRQCSVFLCAYKFVLFFFSSSGLLLLQVWIVSAKKKLPSTKPH